MMDGRQVLRGAIFAMIVLCGLFGSKRSYAGDPLLQWYTLDAGRFRIHYHGGLETTAQRAARLATQIEDQLILLVGSRPNEITNILLSDDSDLANGFAYSLPYSHFDLYVTAPDDMSALGEHDDWLPTLMMHEGTHIVHVNQIAGLPALYNAILGKQLAPIAMQPHWLKEGLAVYAESRLSSGGRLRSPMFDMMIRADVIDKRFASLDQISAEPVRWPGDIYYLYGGKFIEFIANLYGPGVFAAVAQDSSDDVIPFAVSRPFYRATGRPLEDLYAAFRDSTERRVADQLAAVRTRGLREGRALTAHGRSVSYPRYVSARCRRGAGQDRIAHFPATETGALVYYRNDGHERAGYYELPLGSTDPEQATPETLVSRSGVGENASIGPDCSLWFESRPWSKRRYWFNDLFRQLPETTAPTGLEPSRERVTVGRRATDPEISPDGRQLVYVTNRAGTTTLRIAALDANGELRDERALVPSAKTEQVFTPRFSPDGKQVVYSVWTQGGFRDLRIVDVATGQVTQPWKDRATDQQPTFSPDGRWIYFSSDRSGIPNIYAYDIRQDKLRQVTNVLTGAFMPELSPDAKQLYYVGYSSRGFDLYVMALDERAFLEATARPVLRDDRIALDDTGAYPVRPYSPWSTMRPRALEVNYQTEATGQRLTLTAKGSDIARLHNVKATVIFEPQGKSPDVYLDYDYLRLPFGLHTQASRRSDPDRFYRYGTYTGGIEEVRTRVRTGVAIPFPAEFEGQSVSIHYAAEQVSSELPTGLAADPFATVPYEPRRGVSSSLQLEYYYSRTDSTTYGVGDERGIRMYVSVVAAHRGLGSQLEGTRAEGSVTGYVPMPWFRHHVLALSGYAGANTGNAFGGFTFGGYRDPDFLRNLTKGISQGRMPLRGYPSDHFVGNRMVLGQTEYRFPLWLLDHGISTLPVFVRKIAGAFSMDIGGAFDTFDPHAFDRSLHFSYAGELWFDLVLGYTISSRLILGYAVGKGEGAYPGGTTYLALGSRL